MLQELQSRLDNGDVTGALADRRACCELAPHDPRCWSDLGRVYAMERRHREAVLCFREAVEIDENFADGWHNLATSLQKTGHSQGAFNAFKRTLMLEPTRAETYLALGNLLVAGGQFDDAVECFERAAKLDPDLARAHSR